MSLNPSGRNLNEADSLRSSLNAIDRRQFLGAAAASGLALGTGVAAAASKPGGITSTAVTEFYESLSQPQVEAICFPFDHSLRQKINANWHITNPTVGDSFYSKSQREMIDSIVRSITTDDGYDRLNLAMDDDDGGIDAYSVAMFGKPGSGDFQWELTGRHLTLRADGDRMDRVGFGGPIVYGHGEEEASENLYHYQTKKTNEVFEALDGSQRKQALLGKRPKETAVQIQGEKGRFPGISVRDLSGDQKTLVSDALKVLLAPYRPDSVDEVMAILDASGGVESLSMAFYQQGDLDSDRMWDNWRVEGPSFVWHFRGAPHVHAYINIGQVAAVSPNRRRKQQG